MDALGSLAELEALVNAGRRLAGRTLVERDPVLTRLADARELLLAELAEARGVVAERDAILAAGRREVARLRDQVTAARAPRLTDSDITAESQQVLQEASEFAERSLAELEAVLQRVLSAITRARTALDTEGSVLGARGLRQSLVEESEAAR